VEAPLTGPAAELTAPPPRSRQVIVVDAAPYGIDPVVGRHVTDQLRQTASEMGYLVLSPEATILAAQKLQMPYPPAPADLFRVSWVSRSDRGVFARVWAQGGQYVVELTVASTDGTGPFVARASTGAPELHATVDRLLRDTLPPVGAWDLDGAERLRTAHPVTPAVVGPPAGVLIRQTTAEERRRARIPERRWDLALRPEVAIGTSDGGFTNAMFGGKVSFRITSDVLVGAYVGYANLQGRDQRVSNLLFYGLVEDRIRLSPRLPLFLPLRFVGGYLPYNGPFIQLAAGLAYGLSDRFEIGVDILSPTFWFLPDQRAFSLDIAIELVARL